MNNDFIKEMTASNQAMCNMLQGLGEINKKMFKDTTELQLNLANYCLDKGVEWTQLAGKTTNYMDFLNKEAGFASQCSEKMMEIGNKAVNIMTGLRDDTILLFEKNMDTVNKENEKTVSTAKNTSKKAA